ncbi:acid-sensing ion channel 2 isoform X2 [Nematostella vectensis]|uniref:acid-sensing ion channel 2 isoform X2 n=1 Tax=Nematostella vectensis TaxID=45351 RepID=UPI0020770E2F|nr:acid-sensing ion channel 2 isoform X2 [Nematostella vectensis]
MSYNCKVEDSSDINSNNEYRGGSKTRQLIKEFSGYTTLHGFHFLVDSYSVTRRVVWTCFIVISLGFLLYQLVNGIKNYNDRGIIMSRSVEEPNEVDFPAVTICNQNIMKKSLIIGTDAQRYLDEMNYIKADLGLVNSTNERLDAEDFVRKYGHTLGEMMYGCEFKDRRCTAQDFIVSTSFMRGLCYTFNSGRDNSSVRRIATPGRLESLILRLNAQPEEYYGAYSYENVGFVLAVHDQAEPPDMELNAYDIPPGFTTNLRIRRFKGNSLPEPYPTKCGSRNLSLYKRYSRKACIQECYARLIITHCGCRLLGMPPMKVLLKPSKCDCPKRCQHTHYSVQPSLAYYPSKSVIKELLPSLNMTEVNSTTERINEVNRIIREGNAIIRVFYETLRTEIIKEKPQYTLATLTSDMGGSMGLFLGCSVLTICEFIDLFIQICLERRKRNEVIN